MTARSADTWSQADGDVVLLEGPVTIELDRATLSARQAVVWLAPAAPASGAGAGARQRVQVALIGDAKVRQPDIAVTRSGDRMLVTADVSGRVRLTAERTLRDDHDTPLYREAAAMRAGAEEAGPATRPAPPAAGPVPGITATTAPAGGPTTEATEPASIASTTGPATAPITGTDIAPPPPAGVATPANPATAPPAAAPAGRTPARPATRAARQTVPVAFEAGNVETVDAGDGTVATVLTGNVILRQKRPDGDFLELTAQHAILFSRLKSLRDVQKSGGRSRGQNEFTGAYLEGDVRVLLTLQPRPLKPTAPEQRLEANRCYYEFATDRAVLTDVVIHTLNPSPPVPVIIRAKKVRQLAEGEFNAEKVQISSSSFARPTFGVGADRIYVREEMGETRTDDRVEYDAKAATLRVFDVPIFYWPHLSGVADNNEGILRNIGIVHQTGLGTGGYVDLGLFQTLALRQPRDLDAIYRVGYFSDRGPFVGLDARYLGGSITDPTKQAVNFEGQFKSTFIYDKGTDDIGRPLPIRPEGDYRLRGYAQFEHQHYFPEGWQLQLRANWVSDQEFLEQYYPRLFDEELPHDTSVYVKHQVDDEALTLLYQFQPNHLVTSSDYFQEQFEVEHIPEVGYRRLGDSLAGDKLTFFSENTVDGLHFQHTRAPLREQGFVFGISPGLPAQGRTGTTDKIVYRGDFREELDYPLNIGQFKVVPYLLGRYTSYSDSPAGGAKNRFLGGAGARITTAFWKVDDSVQSDLFDLHRLRHVIEPEVNLFTSVETVHQEDVYLYDPRVDPVNDISAAQIALHQRWQTYRGGPGRWRSVDFLSLDVEADLYANQPSRKTLNPYDFRGLFFASAPEISVPRNAINAALQWRISDNTVLLADAQENMDARKLATAAVGLVVRRDVNLDYYLGTRYIAELHSTISTISMDYQLTPKYIVSFGQSVDFEIGKNVETDFYLTRKFDNCSLILRAYTNETTGQNGFGINLVPNGTGYGVDTQTLHDTMGNQR